MKLLDRFEPFFTVLDRLAGGAAAGYVVPEAGRRRSPIRRSLAWVAWLLLLELAIGVAAVAIALVAVVGGAAVSWPVWMRSIVVLGITATLFYFLWRTHKGFYWAYARLRLFSKIFPIITLVLAAIPNLYPVWMVTEQIVFSLILIGVADFLGSDQMREAFPRPPKAARKVT
ncbi:MAG: hypothetical protein EPN48_05850 [Microbacteriaceae bacterium]|nr:MAG: hypothetical protein EPN48_05850 [Microbacteriaceae bacterium]